MKDVVFSRALKGKLPDPMDIIPVLRTRLFGAQTWLKA